MARPREGQFGELTGELMIRVGGQTVPLGNVSVPITGYASGEKLQLQADLSEIKQLVKNLSQRTGEEMAARQEPDNKIEEGNSGY